MSLTFLLPAVISIQQRAAPTTTALHNTIAMTLPRIVKKQSTGNRWSI